MQATEVKSTENHKTNLIEWLLLCLLLAGSGALMLAALHQGVGMSPDSAIYIGSARNLVDGKGLTVPFGDQIDAPLAQFPPLYSVILALPGWAGIDPLAAAAPIQIGIFIGNALLIFWIIKKASGKNRWLSLAGVMVMVLSPSFLSIHQMAWSEGIFIIWVLLALNITSTYLNKSAMSLLVIAAIIAGLGAATRYAGLAFVGALAFGIFLLDKGSLSQRITRGVLFGILGVLPLGFWLLLSLITGGDATTRQLAFHPPGLDQLQTIVNTMASWLLLPQEAPTLLKLGSLGVIVALWIFVVFRLTVSTPNFSYKKYPLLILSALSILAYGGFILISLTFFDANIPLDERILFPVFVCLQILIFGVLGYYFHTSNKTLRIVVCSLLLIFTAISIPKDYQWAMGLYTNGGGFNSPLLRSQEMVTLVNEMPQNLVIYSNSPEAAYFQTGRSALRLPRKIALMSQTSNESFERELKLVKQELISSSGIILYYNWVKGKTTPTQDDLAQAMQLTYLMQNDIGAILTVQK